jgi:hypothetical protein
MVGINVKMLIRVMTPLLARIVFPSVVSWFWLSARTGRITSARPLATQPATKIRRELLALITHMSGPFLCLGQEYDGHAAAWPATLDHAHH